LKAKGMGETGGDRSRRKEAERTEGRRG